MDDPYESDVDVQVGSHSVVAWQSKWTLEEYDVDIHVASGAGVKCELCWTPNSSDVDVQVLQILQSWRSRREVNMSAVGLDTWTILR